MRKRTRIFLSALLAAALLTGCGGNGTNAPSDGAASAQPAQETESGQTEDTFESRGLAGMGSNYRLQTALDKIKAGEAVTVGYIGGSITEGYNAGTSEIFAKLVTEHLDTVYGGGNGTVTYVNAGLSGTPSMLGLIRAQRDMLYAEPDIIFIEFAVNDAQTFTDKQAYESLIRKCLQQENEPAVILLFSITREGYTCQTEMLPIGFYYQLPMVSVKNALSPEIEAGTMTWSDWSDDEAHPNENGHLLYSGMINYLIDTLAAQERDEEYAVPESLKFGKDWSGMQMYDNEQLEVTALGSFAESAAHTAFGSSWSKTAEDTGNEAMTFTFTGSTLFLVYKETTSSAYGTAEVSVDGEVLAHLTACTEDGWNNPVTQLIFSEDASETHTVTIRMQEGDEDKAFDLLAAGICE